MAHEQLAEQQQQQHGAEHARPAKAGGRAGKGAAMVAGSRQALAPLTNMPPLVVAAVVHPSGKAAIMQHPSCNGKIFGSTTAQQQQQQQQQEEEYSAEAEQAFDPTQQQQQQELAGTKTHSGRATAAAASGRHRSTVPASPHLHAHLRSCHHAVKTTEEMQLEQLQREREEVAALRLRNAEAFKHVLQPPPPPVVHSNKPLTEPVDVQLRTSKRQRVHGMETRSMAGCAGAEGSSAGPGSSDALTEKKKAVAAAPGVLTVPKSPAFATSKRARPPRFKPREVVEEEEMAAMPKFKARPWSRDAVLERGKASVPWVPPKPPTAPEPFHLATNLRALEHGSGSSGVAGSSSGMGGPEQPFVFQAGAGSTAGRVTTRTRAKKQGWSGQATNPQPFALATEARAGAKRSAVGEADAHQRQEARPAKRARRSRSGAVHNITDPQPFQLATQARGKLVQVQLEAQRAAEAKAARRAAEFHARCVLWCCCSVSKNFSKSGGAHAHPFFPCRRSPLNRVVLEQPFVAAKVPGDLTMPMDVPLATRGRAAARAAFDEEQVARRAQEEARAVAEAEEQRQAEEAELRKYRRGLVHKPLPLPDGRIVPGRVMP